MTEQEQNLMYNIMEGVYIVGENIGKIAAYCPNFACNAFRDEFLSFVISSLPPACDEDEGVRA